MRARSFVLFWCFALAIVAPVEAAGRRGGESLDRVLPQIRSSVPGTFYDAEGPFFSPSGEPSYRIKWMTPDGRLIWFSVDARSGQVLGGIPGSRAYGQDNGRSRGADPDNRSSSWNRGNFRDDDNGWERPDRNTDRGGWDRGGWDRRDDNARRPDTRNQDTRNQDNRNQDYRNQDGPRPDRSREDRRGWNAPGGSQNYDRGNSGRENPDRGNSGRGADHRGRDDNKRHDRNGR